jgi:hypothetical protein
MNTQAGTRAPAEASKAHTSPSNLLLLPRKKEISTKHARTHSRESAPHYSHTLTTAAIEQQVIKVGRIEKGFYLAMEQEHPAAIQIHPVKRPPLLPVATLLPQSSPPRLRLRLRPHFPLPQPPRSRSRSAPPAGSCRGSSRASSGGSGFPSSATAGFDEEY